VKGKNNMFDDIKIGEGKHGNSWTKYLKHDAGRFISHNDVSYLCHDIFGSLGIIIMKDTTEGINLKELLVNQTSIEKINMYLLEIVLKNIKTIDFIKELELIKRNQFNNGIVYTQEQLQKVLGL
jgi:hypothetical protein